MKLTASQKAALLWLRNRNGDGVFGEKSNNSVLLAGGDRAPVMRGTWNNLEKAGMVERYGKKRLRVTAAGYAEPMDGVQEARS